MQRLLWALYVEHAWIPGTEQVLAPASALHGAALHQHNAGRLAAHRLIAHLFPSDEEPP